MSTRNTPLKNQAEAQKETGYGPIKLRRDDDYAIVEVEVGGEWIEVIREHTDSNFYHLVEPTGILQCVKDRRRKAR